MLLTAGSPQGLLQGTLLMGLCCPHGLFSVWGCHNPSSWMNGATVETAGAREPQRERDRERETETERERDREREKKKQRSNNTWVETGGRSRTGEPGGTESSRRLWSTVPGKPPSRDSSLLRSLCCTAQSSTPSPVRMRWGHLPVFLQVGKSRLERQRFACGHRTVTEQTLASAGLRRGSPPRRPTELDANTSTAESGREPGGDRRRGCDREGPLQIPP